MSEKVQAVVYRPRELQIDVSNVHGIGRLVVPPAPGSVFDLATTFTTSASISGRQAFRGEKYPEQNVSHCVGWCYRVEVWSDPNFPQADEI